jgi:isoleucyl-tRNA synthetase
MKANLAQREPEMLKQWEEEDLYGAMSQAGAGRPLYILHDGPPMPTAICTWATP